MFFKTFNFYYKHPCYASKVYKLSPPKPLLKAGTPVTVTYRAIGRIFSLRGYVVSVRGKNLLSKNSCIVVRAKLCGIGVQLTLIYFSIGSFKYRRNDYRRIQSSKGVKVFRTSKLYYRKYNYKRVR